MKAHLIDTHLVVLRSRSSVKVKIIYQDYQDHILKKKWLSLKAFVFHKYMFDKIFTKGNCGASAPACYAPVFHIDQFNFFCLLHVYTM